jgi:phosphoglycolate phosphatase-like HAD superfamily hydrolase
MAETKAKKTATKKAAANEDIVETVDFDDKDLDKSVVIYNIAGWNVTFALRNREGDVLLTKKSKQRLPRNEIQAQIYNGNKLFSGTDGNGSHATIYIEDKATRIWLGFETADKPQKIFTDDVARKLFAMSQSEFEQELPNYIATSAEKYALNEAIERLGFNDYRKIVYASKYTGYPLR